METKNSGRTQKKAFAIVIIVILLFAFEIYSIAVVHLEGQTDLPDNYGNFQSNRDTLAQQATKEQFSFAVVGDIEESRTFETLCDKLRDEPLSFMVMLGDIVLECGKDNHAFFRAECAKKYRLPFPVFIVAGNRDVAYDEMEQDIDKVSLNDFEGMYGPPNFSFEYNECLFIGLCLLPAPYSTETSIEFLKSTLKKKRKDNQKVFVFMHVPPVLKPNTVTPSFENSQEFVDIINQYKVDYVISAHYHGYIRNEFGGTIYLVSGGGGGGLDETKSFGGLYHVVVLTVDPESVSEKEIFAQPRIDIPGAVKRFAMADLYPFFTRHPVLTIVENIVMICMIAFVSLSARIKT
jgi:Icc-related predicted phosphoesterase